MPTNYNLPQIPATPLGPLSGFYRGQQYDLAMQDAEKEFRNKDITNNRLENLYQNELLDNPMKENERAQKIAEAIYQQDLINSGAKREAFDTEVASKKAGTEGQKLLNQQKQILIAADALNQAASLPELAKEAMWEDLRKDLTSKYVKFPAGPYSVENSQILKSQAAAALQTREHLQKLAQQEQEGTIRSNLNIQEFGFRAGESAKDRENRLEAARIQAAAMGNKPPTGNAYEQAVKSARAKTESGQPIMASDILTISSTMDKSDNKTETEMKGKILNELRPLNTKPPEAIERFAATYGISKEDVAKFKNKSGGYDVEALAVYMAKEYSTGLSLYEAWKSTGGGKMPEDEWARIFRMNKQAGLLIKEHGGVLERGEKPAPAKPAENKPTMATPGEVQGDWNKFVNDAVLSEQKKGRSVTFAMVQKRLMDLGYYPKGSKAKQSASPVAIPPAYAGASTD